MSKSIQLKNKENEKMYPHPYYPVGSIYLSVNDTNPSEWFGGTWEQIAKGRTLVGVDTNDTDFNIVKKIGGSKFLQKHNHEITPNSNLYAYNYGGNAETAVPSAGDVGRGIGRYYVNTGTKDTGNGSSGNLQPYFTCYIWCRTA